MTKLIELLRGLERDQFYGNLQIEFQAGDVTIVRKQQTIKLNDRKQSNDDFRK